VGPPSRHRHDDADTARDLAGRRRRHEVAPGRDRHEPDAGRHARRREAVHEIGPGRQLPDDGRVRIDADVQRPLGHVEPQVGGEPRVRRAHGRRQVRPPVRRPERDDDAQPAEVVPAFGQVEQREPRDQATERVGVQVDGGVGVGAEHVLDEVRQPPGRDGDVALGVSRAVGPSRQLGEVAARRRRPPPGVAEAEHPAGLVAELRAPEVVDGRLGRARTQPRHGDRDPPLPRCRPTRRRLGRARRRRQQPSRQVVHEVEATPVGVVGGGGQLRPGPVPEPVEGAPEHPGGVEVAHDVPQRGRLGGGRLRPGLGRHQLDLDDDPGEQRRRIDVDVAGPDPEVQPVARGADPLALLDRLADRDVDAGQEGVARPQPVRMPDGHVQRPGHRSGEQHGPRCAGAHGCAWRGGVLDPPVAGPVRRGRRPERIGDRRIDRGQIRPARRLRLRPGRRRRDEHDDEDLPDDDGQCHRHPRQTRPAEVPHRGPPTPAPPPRPAEAPPAVRGRCGPRSVGQRAGGTRTGLVVVVGGGSVLVGGRGGAHGDPPWWRASAGRPLAAVVRIGPGPRAGRARPGGYQRRPSAAIPAHPRAAVPPGQGRASGGRSRDVPIRASGPGGRVRPARARWRRVGA
jgi:hypothetical protein